MCSLLLPGGWALHMFTYCHLEASTYICLPIVTWRLVPVRCVLCCYLEAGPNTCLPIAIWRLVPLRCVLCCYLEAGPYTCLPIAIWRLVPGVETPCLPIYIMGKAVLFIFTLKHAHGKNKNKMR
jgi:hypothetical protein